MEAMEAMEAMKKLITGQKTIFQLPLVISSKKLSSKHVLLHQEQGQVFQVALFSGHTVVLTWGRSGSTIKIDFLPFLVLSQKNTVVSDDFLSALKNKGTLRPLQVFL